MTDLRGDGSSSPVESSGLEGARMVKRRPVPSVCRRATWTSRRVTAPIGDAEYGHGPGRVLTASDQPRLRVAGSTWACEAATSHSSSTPGPWVATAARAYILGWISPMVRT